MDQKVPTKDYGVLRCVLWKSFVGGLAIGRRSCGGGDGGTLRTITLRSAALKGLHANPVITLENRSTIEYKV